MATYLAFVNRKGVTLYSIHFNRMFASARHRNTGKENENTAQCLSFRHYNRKASIDSVAVEYDFRAKNAPRIPIARTHQQAIKLIRPIVVNLEGKDGMSFGKFQYQSAIDAAQFDVNHEDGSSHGFAFHPPERSYKSGGEADAK